MKNFEVPIPTGGNRCHYLNRDRKLEIVEIINVLGNLKESTKVLNNKLKFLFRIQTSYLTPLNPNFLPRLLSLVGGPRSVNRSTRYKYLRNLFYGTSSLLIKIKTPFESKESESLQFTVRVPVRSLSPTLGSKGSGYTKS